ncbi:2-hydroxyacyl-CoA dehydratase family protein [Qaidamihabitans albus]|uniref:2-hydroxyacyl-CoA dehydratase family protein n=1 Tax=Qaidamihabitans albus TaxID=2795733 RepID=UPI0018F19D82|nr:2-hydroxyacyl-CoA dehydratase family protein [Qaidamihabitans albus]
MPAALAQLLDHAADRTSAARRWSAAGRAVAGYVGADVPVELLTAAGMLPVRLAGTPGADAALGDRYLGTGVDPVARSVLSTLLEGGYGHLDALIVSSDCEASRRLFYAVRELRRLEPEQALPPAYLVDVLHLPHRTTTGYVLAKVAQLRAWIAELAGQPIRDADLAAAIAAHDRLRGLLSRFSELRRREPARLSGVQALGVVAATTVLPVPRAIELLERLLDEAGRLPVATGDRVFVTGSSHDGPDVYAALERAGLLVVGEDHDWGDLLFHRPVGGTTELALAERYQHNGPTGPRASIRRRAAHTASSAAASRAEILLSYCRVQDPGPPWDFPRQRAEAGLPAVLLERQPYGVVDVDALRLALGEATAQRDIAR